MYKYLLIILSLHNVLKIKFNKIYSANYFILTNDDTIIDKRSSYYFDIKHLKLSLNLIRLSSLNYKIFFKIIKIPNFFCFSLIKEISQNDKFFFFMIKKIFQYLKIRKFVFIDDYREMKFFYKLSRELKIKTLAYMHGKFTKNSIILNKTFFSKYLIWSDFFFKQLVQANRKYDKKNTKIIGCPYLKVLDKSKKSSKEIKIKKCLILDEDYLNFSEIKHYLDVLVKIKNVKLYIKKKISRKLPNEYVSYCKINKIKIINENLNLGKIVKKYQIDCVIASTSTGLIESSFYNAVPLKINSNNKNREKEFNEFVKLNLVYNINSPTMIFKFIRRKYKSRIINQIKNKLWGNHVFLEKKTKNYILNFIKN